MTHINAWRKPGFHGANSSMVLQLFLVYTQVGCGVPTASTIPKWIIWHFRAWAQSNILDFTKEHHSFWHPPQLSQPRPPSNSLPFEIRETNLSPCAEVCAKHCPTPPTKTFSTGGPTSTTSWTPCGVSPATTNCTMPLIVCVAKCLSLQARIAIRLIVHIGAYLVMALMICRVCDWEAMCKPLPQALVSGCIQFWP